MERHIDVAYTVVVVTSLNGEFISIFPPYVGIPRPSELVSLKGFSSGLFPKYHHHSLYFPLNPPSDIITLEKIQFV